MAARRRLDVELVRRGLAESREAAHRLIEDGRVLVGGARADKSSRQVSTADAVLVEGERARFVSRGGDKLAAALAVFELDPAGLRCLDAGSSTGGFTDCLLQAGAATVTALDVGTNQLHERIRADRRVTVMERTNLRNVVAEDVGGAFELVVADLSFISLVTVADSLLGLTLPSAELVLLVKPQFEVGKADADKARGVITDPRLWASATAGVVAAFVERGADALGLVPSPLRGGSGNVELLLHLRAPSSGTSGPGAVPAGLVEEAVASAG